MGGNAKGLYVVIGILIALVVGGGIYIYNEEQKPSGVELKIGEGGISLEEK